MLVVIDVVVLQEVEQCALKNIFGQTLVLDNLRGKYIYFQLENVSKTL